MMSTFFTLAHLELIPLSLQEALLFAIVGHVSLKLFALFLGWADVDPSLYILKVRSDHNHHHISLTDTVTVLILGLDGDI